MNNTLPYHLPSLRLMYPLMCATRVMVVPLLVLLVAAEARKWHELPCGEVTSCTDLWHGMPGGYSRHHHLAPPLPQEVQQEVSVRE